MRNVLAALILASLAGVSLATPVSHQASANEIVASTKQLAAKNCRPRNLGGGEHISGCEYSPAFIDGQWSVIVRYVMVDENGKRERVMGAFSLYIFSKSGKFIKIIPGM